MFVPEPPHEESLVTADPTSIIKLKELIYGASNPLIYTRYLGRNPKAVHKLVKLTDLLKIPVFEMPGYMNYPTNNPLHMSTSILPYVKESDLILVIDSSSWPPWYPPNSIRGKTDAKIVFIAGDGYEKGWSREFPLSKIKDHKEDFLLAVAMNGHPLAIEHGYPARLALDSELGSLWVKWLNKIVIVPEDGTSEEYNT